MTPILPWIAHFYTATGAVIALLATAMTFAHNFRAAFIFLIAATFVDATDGALARVLRVKERLPHFDGARLDDIVDYLNYVFVPALVVFQAALVPSAFPVCAAMVLSSAYGFVQAEAKVRTADYFFTGFPSYWNIVVVYLYVLGLRQDVNAAILIVLSVLVFVPIRYVYPTRTTTWRTATLALGTIWGLQIIHLVWRLPATDGPWTMLSLLYPIYYAGLSLWLNVNDRSRRP